MAIADEGAVANEDAGLELVLDGLGRDEFAAGGLEEFLLAVGDVEESVIVDAADVAGSEPAFAVDGVVRCVFPVALKDAGAADEELAVLGDAALDVGERLAHRAHAIGVGGVQRDDGRGFREAVAFEDADAGGGEPVGGVEAERRAAGDGVAHAAAESCLEFFVDEGVGDLPGER